MKIDCASCQICRSICPAGIDIPFFLGIYEQYKEDVANALRECKRTGGKKGPENCIECGACQTYCPQEIKVMEYIREMAMEEQIFAFEKV